jgi:hypothetical protein
MQKDVFKQHCEENKQDFKEVKDIITNLRDNHIAHLSADVVRVKTNQEWQIKFFWVITTAAVGSMVVGILNLI